MTHPFPFYCSLLPTSFFFFSSDFGVSARLTKILTKTIFFFFFYQRNTSKKSFFYRSRVKLTGGCHCGSKLRPSVIYKNQLSQTLTGSPKKKNKIDFIDEWREVGRKNVLFNCCPDHRVGAPFEFTTNKYLRVISTVHAIHCRSSSVIYAVQYVITILHINAFYRITQV